jgi:hypothetical protein
MVLSKAANDVIGCLVGSSSEALLWFIPLEGVLENISKHAARCD